jgi:hypothetical protein
VIIVWVEVTPGRHAMVATRIARSCALSRTTISTTHAPVISFTVWALRAVINSSTTVVSASPPRTHTRAVPVTSRHGLGTISHAIPTPDPSANARLLQQGYVVELRRSTVSRQPRVLTV